MNANYNNDMKSADRLMYFNVGDHSSTVFMAFHDRRKNMWLRRRWLDFRQGHTIYLVFLMTFANFVTIQYSLLLERVPQFNSILPNILVFAIVFIVIYFPLAIAIGYWHRKSQWKVEQEALFKENVIGATMWLFMIDLIEGKVTEEEKKEMRAMLSKIVKQSTRIPVKGDGLLEKASEQAAKTDPSNIS
jgi:hypothetical protein